MKTIITTSDKCAAFITSSTQCLKQATGTFKARNPVGQTQQLMCDDCAKKAEQEFKINSLGYCLFVVGKNETSY